MNNDDFEDDIVLLSIMDVFMPESGTIMSGMLDINISQ
jgi:hypothetical protein